MSVTDWRGRAVTNDDDDLPIDESISRRREARSLLGSLLRPYATTVALLAIVVVVENAARLSVPLLVQRGIDHGIPPIVDGHSAHQLLVIVVSLCGVVLVQAVSRMYFLRRSGRIGQEVLLELRRRIFRHFQRLDVAFHDRYTSGRVVSRLTNDVEAIQELLSNGFDGLVTALLTMVGTAVLLLYVALCARGLRAALQRTDGFGKLLAVGLTTVIALQTFVIVGGILRVIPLTGITLPFVSYGGSSVVSNFFLLAGLMLISNRANRESAT